MHFYLDCINYPRGKPNSRYGPRKKRKESKLRKTSRGFRINGEFTGPLCTREVVATVNAISPFFPPRAVVPRHRAVVVFANDNEPFSEKFREVDCRGLFCEIFSARIRCVQNQRPETQNTRF